MTFKTAAKGFGNGLLTTATILANSGIQTQITEIDVEIAELEKKLEELKSNRAELKTRLH